jgi:hypothetical protein
VDRDKIKFQGWFDLVCRNPDGSVAWEERLVLNGTTTAGLTNNLGVYFVSGTQITTWYGGLVDNAGFSAFAAADTMSSHAGWTEFTNYGESVRQTWSPGAPAGGIVTGAFGTFTISASGTLKGAFVVSNNTKGGTTGVLWATGAFSSAQAVVSGQVITLSYTCTCTGG